MKPFYEIRICDDGAGGLAAVLDNDEGRRFAGSSLEAFRRAKELASSGRRTVKFILNGERGLIFPDGTMRTYSYGKDGGWRKVDSSKFEERLRSDDATSGSEEWFDASTLPVHESAPTDGRSRHLVILNFDSDVALLFLKEFGKDGELLLRMEEKGGVDDVLEKAYSIAEDAGKSLVNYQIVVEQDGVPVCFESGYVTEDGTLVPARSEEQEELNPPVDGESLAGAAKEVLSESPEIYRGIDVSETLADAGLPGYLRYAVLNTSDHSDCHGEFRKRITVDDLTVDGRPYREALKGAGYSDSDVEEAASDGSGRIYGRLGGHCIVERVPKDGRLEAVMVSPWLPDGSVIGSGMCAIKAPFIEAFNRKRIDVPKYGVHVVLVDSDVVDREWTYHRLYVDDPEKAALLWGSGVPKSFPRLSMMVESAGEEASSDAVDSAIDLAVKRLRLAPEEVRTLEPGREWVKKEAARWLRRNPDPIFRKDYNVYKVVEPMVGQWLLNHGRKLISIGESVGKDDGKMDWYLEVRSVKDADATLFMDGPDDGRHREYDGLAAFRKAKDLVKEGIVVSVSKVRRDERNPWVPKVVADGFLAQDGDSWVVRREMGKDVSLSI